MLSADVGHKDGARGLTFLTVRTHGMHHVEVAGQTELAGNRVLADRTLLWQPDADVVHGLEVSQQIIQVCGIILALNARLTLKPLRHVYVQHVLGRLYGVLRQHQTHLTDSPPLVVVVPGHNSSAPAVVCLHVFGGPLLLLEVEFADRAVKGGVDVSVHLRMLRRLFLRQRYLVALGALEGTSVLLQVLLQLHPSRTVQLAHRARLRKLGGRLLRTLAVLLVVDHGNTAARLEAARLAVKLGRVFRIDMRRHVHHLREIVTAVVAREFPIGMRAPLVRQQRHLRIATEAADAGVSVGHSSVLPKIVSTDEFYIALGTKIIDRRPLRRGPPYQRLAHHRWSPLGLQVAAFHVALEPRPVGEQLEAAGALKRHLPYVQLQVRSVSSPRHTRLQTYAASYVTARVVC